jgi:GntR family transcriptional regulator, transcriptional repressor for pyruvate dehydrogenase complex
MLLKLNRGTLAEQVAERLLEYIAAQELRPGDLLPSETSLANSFNVSRPVIREALKNLEGKGVIEIVNGKGALIRPIDSDPLRDFFLRVMQMEKSSILELMEVRRGLEVQAASLAAQRRNPKDLETIQKAVRAMRASMQDLDTYTRLDVEFHLAIASASHNSILGLLVESIRDSLRSTISAGLLSRGNNLNLEVIQDTHEALLKAIEEGESEEAMLTMLQHFDEAISAISHSPE